MFLPPFVVAFLDFVKFEVVFDETAAYDEVDGCGDKEKFVKPLANWGLFSCFDEFSCPFFATEIASKASSASIVLSSLVQTRDWNSICKNFMEKRAISAKGVTTIQN